MQKGTAARSVAAIAAELKIPSFIVELRHSSTHVDLPALPMLELAAQAALAWLQENYWQKQATAFRETRVSTRQLLRDFKETASKSASRTKKASRKSSSKADAGKSILRKLTSGIAPNMVDELVVAPLLDPGLLAPTNSEVGSGSDATTAARDRVAVWSPALEAFSVAWPDFACLILDKLVDKLLDLQPKLVRGASTRTAHTVKKSATAFAVREAGAAVMALEESELSAVAARSFKWYTVIAVHVLDEFQPDDARHLRHVARRIVGSPCPELQPLLRKLLDHLRSYIGPGIGDRVLLAFDIASNFPAPVPLMGTSDRLDISGDMSKDQAHDTACAHTEWTDAATFYDSVQALVRQSGVADATTADTGAMKTSIWQLERDIGWGMCPIGALPTGRMGGGPHLHPRSASKGKSEINDEHSDPRSQKRLRRCLGDDESDYFLAVSSSIALM